MPHRSPQQKRAVPVFKYVFMGHVYEIQTISSGQFSGERCVKKDFHSSVKH